MKSSQTISTPNFILGFAISAQLTLVATSLLLHWTVVGIAMTLTSIISLVVLVLRFENERRQVRSAVQRINQGGSSQNVLDDLNAISLSMTNASIIVKALRDNSVVSPELISSSGQIGRSLAELQEKLSLYRSDDQRRSWSQDGIAKFSEVLKRGKTLKELATLVISQMVTYLQANQGGLFVQEEDQNGERYVELVGCYAYGKNKFVEGRIHEGQGLIGECMLGQSTIYMTQVPKNYVRITSGLGEATPTSIIILPLKFNQKFYGVIELASFQVFGQHQIEFLERVSENIAAEIATRKSVQDTERLLNESNRMARELQSHEEEMRQQMEELTSTQEEMSRKQAELSSILSAIDNTVASLEFDLSGKVLKANSIFAGVAGYQEHELLALRYERLLPAGEHAKPQHQMMWENLRSGKFFEGEFRFMSRSGEELWLSGTFNPIFDSKGEAFKVIMIGHFTTQQKQKNAELTGFVSALKNSIPFVELDGQFVCKSASERFLKFFQMKRIELKDKRFCTLLANNVSNDTLSGHLAAAPQQFYEQDLTYMVDGKPVKMRTSFTPVRDQQNRLLKIIAVLNAEVPSREIAVAAVA